MLFVICCSRLACLSLARFLLLLVVVGVVGVCCILALLLNVDVVVVCCWIVLIVVVCRVLSLFVDVGDVVVLCCCFVSFVVVCWCCGFRRSCLFFGVRCLLCVAVVC